ncbi:multiple sugar transport system substrate-binding protein [Streptomyces sp. LBL]|uniref:ABC transporter substrate-binding protein n=1 Tax=Streptomyces sp. LBL TaxID=2940562 RepID=UPI002473C6A2|nr:sugar ABC transporter substrate-binding protein [Streptomyces sp. LBL]MDH6622554.1 multiple sugar transport system substrate-binding protein [Streptomyces sp. LBL]
MGKRSRSSGTGTTRTTRALATGLTAVIIGAGVACGSGDQNSGGSQEANGAVTLTWSMWASGTEDRNAWQKVADEVHAENPKIRIKLDTSPFTDYFTKLGTRLAGGSAPCIVSMQSLRTGGYTDGMLPLGDLIAKNKLDIGSFNQSIIEGLASGGKQYALPYDFGSLVVTYNKDMFKAAGIPEPKVGWSMAEFEAAAKKLTRNGKYGFVAYPVDLYMFPMLLSRTGAEPVGEDGKLALTGKTMGTAFDWYSGLSAKERVAPKVPGVDNTFPDTQFLNGNAAMSVNGPWSVLSLKGQAKFGVGLATIPAGPDGTKTFSAGSGFGISSSCKYPDQAFQAIRTMTSAKVLGELGAEGRAFPARTAVQDQWYKNAFPGAQEVIDAANKSATPFKTTNNWDQVTKLLAQYGVQAFNGQESGESALEQVQQQAGTG